MAEFSNNNLGSSLVSKTGDVSEGAPNLQVRRPGDGTICSADAFEQDLVVLIRVVGVV